ncbi:MAG: TrkA family potassium uptake protein [Oscillospiraceae bacterium]|nr:TrkA family potassium uptake protein [Oscillospiraceae bacterium]
MKTFVVIGLGRFGTAVAEELCELGHEVLAVDAFEEPVQEIADKVTHAAICDARSASALSSLGVRNYDCAIVSVGNDLGTSTLITLNLKEMGVPQVICKAQSHIHRRLLEKIGADQVVFPEHEMGLKLAHNLVGTNVINYLELSKDYGLVEIPAPQSWWGRHLSDLNVRAQYGVNIMAVRHQGEEDLTVAPGAAFEIKTGDHLVVVGRLDAIRHIRSL